MGQAATGCRHGEAPYSWAIGQRDQPGSLFNRQSLFKEAVHNPRPPGYKTITAPIVNFSLLDRYLTAT